MFENKKLTECELASVAGGREFAALGKVSFGETKTHSLAGVDLGRDVSKRPGDLRKEPTKDHLPIYTPVN